MAVISSFFYNFLMELCHDYIYSVKNYIFHFRKKTQWTQLFRYNYAALPSIVSQIPKKCKNIHILIDFEETAENMQVSIINSSELESINSSTILWYSFFNINVKKVLLTLSHKIS